MKDHEESGVEPCRSAETVGEAGDDVPEDAERVVKRLRDGVSRPTTILEKERIADCLEALTRENAALRADKERLEQRKRYYKELCSASDEDRIDAQHRLAQMEICPDCKGSGEYADWGGECPLCGGTGGDPAYRAEAAERRLAEQGQAPSPEPDQWQRLRDLLGLDGWHEGIWHGLPNPAQIVSHVEHVANERARLLKASLSSPDPDAELVTDFWHTNYVNKGHCGLCGNIGKIDTRGVKTPAGFECGGIFDCLCPNGQTLARHRKQGGE